MHDPSSSAVLDGPVAGSAAPAPVQAPAAVPPPTVVPAASAPAAPTAVPARPVAAQPAAPQPVAAKPAPPKPAPAAVNAPARPPAATKPAAPAATPESAPRPVPAAAAAPAVVAPPAPAAPAPAPVPPSPVAAAPAPVPAAAAAAAAPAPAVPPAAVPQKAPPQKAPAAANPSRSVSKDWKRRLEGNSLQDLTGELVRSLPAFIGSMVLHLFIALGLALFVFSPEVREELIKAITVSEKEVTEEEPIEIIKDDLTPENLESLEAEVSTMNVDSEVVKDQANPLELNVNDLDPSMTEVETNDANGPNIKISGELSGRSQASRGALAKSQGGTPESEAAVNSGLKWLAKIQRPDGSWSYQHGMDDPGSVRNDMGATGMALLAFLGAGHTHKQGDYEKVVMGGLSYLTANMKRTPAGGDLRGQITSNEGMYVQGICTIALCEAYALSRDKKLKEYAQAAVDFVANAQDPRGGGWRYSPQEAGDTSVVGWQIMALKSGNFAKLKVNKSVIGKATFFLNSVQAEGGAKYGYTGPGAGPATTGIGLLCRMYLGWTPKQKALVQGVEYLSTMGPSTDMYYNYYGTQVMHHWGGDHWKKWNEKMRQQLVTTQEKDGSAAGSWKPVGGHSAAGGRLYQTCLSVMTLEVYYRHLPLYQRQSVTTEF